MGHGHGHGHARLDVPPRTRRLLLALAGGLGLAVVVGLWFLWPTGDPTEGARPLGAVGPAYEARVESAQPGPCPGQSTEADVLSGDCIEVAFELLAGPDRGETTTITFPVDAPSTPTFLVGEEVILAYEEQAEPGFEYSYLDRQRRPVLLWLALLFAVAVVLFGRLRGLAALGGLAASLVVLLAFIVPAILDGQNPVFVAVVGCGAIAFLVLYLAHGASSMTTVALLGTLSSLALTALLARLFVTLAQLSGFASEEAVIVQLSTTQIDAAGLVLAGVVIGALGALDDVTVTQASAVWELRAANPAMTARELYRAGVRIGRDHIASTVNTLLLAYVGASMPLLLFFVLSQQSLGTIANEEIVATEIVRTLVGSISLVASVPITTWLGARVVTASGTASEETASGE